MYIKCTHKNREISKPMRQHFVSINYLAGFFISCHNLPLNGNFRSNYSMPKNYTIYKKIVGLYQKCQRKQLNKCDGFGQNDNSITRHPVSLEYYEITKINNNNEKMKDFASIND